MDSDNTTRNSKIKYFSVDVDGARIRDQLSFVEAVDAAMEFRQQVPDSYIHVSDADAPPLAPT